MTQNQKYDVIILGTGLVGTITASVLARQGLKVICIDSQKHPRFAIGESIVRETTKWAKIIADRFDVPEIAFLGDYDSARRKISDKTGIKRNLGFIYHHEGQQQNPEEVFQATVVESLNPSEIHIYRPDTDLFYLEVAKKYGAQILEETTVDHIEFFENEVEVTLHTKESIRAQFLIDGTGLNSVLSKKFDLREKAPSLHTNSRSVFVHVENLPGFEECSNYCHDVPQAWSQGTTHHLFDGGWMWIIPFNNGLNPKNKSVSVGFCLDTQKYPKPVGMSAEAEFKAILSRFPSIENQFKNAKPVTPYVSTGRMNHLCKKVAGHRFALVGMAAGFVDPLYSRGMAVGFASVNVLADTILRCFKDNDFSVERFRLFEEYQINATRAVDDMVSSSYISMQDFTLFNSWIRVWQSTISLGFLHLNAAHNKFLMMGKDPDLLLKEAYSKHVGSWVASSPTFNRYWAHANGVMRGVQRGAVSVKDAAEDVLHSLRETNLFPVGNTEHFPMAYTVLDPTKKHTPDYNLEFFEMMMSWGYNESIPEARSLFFPGDSKAVLGNFKMQLDKLRAFQSTDEFYQYLKSADENYQTKLAKARLKTLKKAA